MKKELGAFAANSLYSFTIFGRDGVIRTLDPLHPMQVRYQAALRPDDGEIIADGLPNLHGKGGDPAQQVCDSGKAVSPAHNRPARHTHLH